MQQERKKGTFSINCDENITVVANRENIEDRDHGYATSLDMYIYLWKENIEEGESVMTAEYRL